MKLLLASDFYPPFIGGTELQTALIARGMVERGHDVHVATVWHSGLPAVEEIHGATIHRLRGFFTSLPWFASVPGRRYHPPFPEPVLTLRLRSLCADFQPDLVHASGWIAYSCALAAARRDIPLMVSARDYGYGCAIRTLVHQGSVCSGPELGKCLRCASATYGPAKAAAAVFGVRAGRNLLGRRLAAIHAPTRYVEARIADHGLVGNGRALHAAIPDMLGDDAPLRRACGIRRQLPKEPYILFVGALQPHKGLRVLLEAYSGLKAPPPLVLIGTRWPETPATFPAGVHVLTSVPHRDVMDAWSRCLFGVAPSLWPEALGDVVIEAMSRGKPMIASAIGGLAETVKHRETGLLTRPGDVRGLARAMQKLIRDAALRKQLGAGAARAARRYQRERVIAELESFYGQVLERWHSSS